MSKSKTNIDVELYIGGYDLSTVPSDYVEMINREFSKGLNEIFSSNPIFNLGKVSYLLNKNDRVNIQLRLCVDMNLEEVKRHVSLDELKRLCKNSYSELTLYYFKEEIKSINVKVNPKMDNQTNNIKENDDDDYIKKTAQRFQPLEPFYTFEHLVIGQKTLEEIEIAMNVQNNGEKVFNDWGLSSIEPFPRAVLNFYGPPGTGKTLAAHAMANKLGKKIIIAGCPEIQSKYHGEGPKNVKAVFYSAELNDAILFFDEADSLLSKRLEEVNTGAEDEINNMRNAMLTCLESHTGIVIFASNFVKRYDYAFETRVQSVNFPLPDEEGRTKLWRKLFSLTQIPIEGSLNYIELAKQCDGFCGRDIKNALVKACLTVAYHDRDKITQNDIRLACEKIVKTRDDIKSADYNRVELNDPVKEVIEDRINKHIEESK